MSESANEKGFLLFVMGAQRDEECVRARSTLLYDPTAGPVTLPTGEWSMWRLGNGGADVVCHLPGASIKDYASGGGSLDQDLELRQRQPVTNSDVVMWRAECRHEVCIDTGMDNYTPPFFLSSEPDTDGARFDVLVKLLPDRLSGLADVLAFVALVREMEAMEASEPIIEFSRSALASFASWAYWLMVRVFGAKPASDPGLADCEAQMAEEEPYSTLTLAEAESTPFAPGLHLPVSVSDDERYHCGVLRLDEAVDSNMWRSTLYLAGFKLRLAPGASLSRTAFWTYRGKTNSVSRDVATVIDVISSSPDLT